MDDRRSPPRSHRNSRLHRLVLTAALLLAGLGTSKRSVAEVTPPVNSELALSAIPGVDPYALRPSVMLGLMQWLAFGGGNVAAQVKFGRWVVEYSHGQALQFERVAGLALTAPERAAGVAVGMPWTTGGGFGIQLTPKLHLLVEAKVHRYLVQDDFGHRLSYTSLTVGPGLFYDLYVYRGLFLQPNLRWWPTLASSHGSSGNLLASDGSSYRHERHDLLPFVNVNLGWTFSLQ
jgi:hypothetical protein